MGVNAVREDGCYADNPNLMRLASGLRVDPLNLRVCDIRVDDIAHALSRTCRYNGHCKGFISVARHSTWVAKETWDLAVHEGLPADRCATLALAGLFHDAAEAYLGDMIRPLKHRPEMGIFQEYESMAEAVIFTHLRLPYPLPDLVLEADRLVNVWEFENIVPHQTPASWNFSSDTGEFLQAYERYTFWRLTPTVYDHEHEAAADRT